jgi:hypothetical protein
VAGERTTAVRVSFGSVRVGVVVGRSARHTSLFPDAKTRTYLLPVKKSSRVAEQQHAGDMADVELEIES